MNLHEAARGGNHRPPVWVASMARMHKKQGFEIPAKRSSPKTSAANARAVPDAVTVSRANDKPLPASAKRNPWPMKIFCVLVSPGLLLSTPTGVDMGWRHARQRRRYGATLAAGVLVPALLPLF